jgi:hypothetical protein
LEEVLVDGGIKLEAGVSAEGRICEGDIELLVRAKRGITILMVTQGSQ